MPVIYDKASQAQLFWEPKILGQQGFLFKDVEIGRWNNRIWSNLAQSGNNYGLKTCLFECHKDERRKL